MHRREQVAQSINGSLHRLPLVLEILGEIHESKGPALTGDDDLRHGSIRAVQTMVERLYRISPAPLPVGSLTAAEEIAASWIKGETPGKLLPPPLLDQITASLCRLLPGSLETIRRSGRIG